MVARTHTLFTTRDVRGIGRQRIAIDVDNAASVTELDGGAAFLIVVEGQAHEVEAGEYKLEDLVDIEPAPAAKKPAK